MSNWLFKVRMQTLISMFKFTNFINLSQFPDLKLYNIIAVSGLSI